MHCCCTAVWSRSDLFGSRLLALILRATPAVREEVLSLPIRMCLDDRLSPKASKEASPDTTHHAQIAFAVHVMELLRLSVLEREADILGCWIRFA